MPRYSAWFWTRCKDDHAAAEDAHLDRGRSDRPAPWLRRAECAGADEAGTESILRSRVCLPGPTRRSDQDFMVGWRWSLPFRQVTGFTLHLFRLDLKVLISSPFSGLPLGRLACPIGCNVWSADCPPTRKGTRAH